MVRGDVDQGRGFVPLREVGVGFRFYRPEGAGDEREDARDFRFYLCFWD
jgi:hypothetical protein